VEDRFHIASDTKAMTATLAGIQIDKGELGMPKPGACGFWLGIGQARLVGEALTHDGSNDMNLATVLVDIDNHLAIAIATNFPRLSDAACGGAR
jgi:hypothetical protein